MLVLLKLISGETLMGELADECVDTYQISKPSVLMPIPGENGRVGITFNNFIAGASSLLDEVEIKKEHVMLRVSELKIHETMIGAYKERFSVIHKP